MTQQDESAIPRRWRCPDCELPNQWDAIECARCRTISPPDRERWEYKPFVRSPIEALVSPVGRPPSDHERLDVDCENDANPCPAAWPDKVELWCVGCLLDRLAALEHERDEEERNHDDTYQKLIKAMFIVRKRAEHADAALLSLQTATGWQPIETAPKETRVLAVLKPRPFEATGEIAFVYWVQGVWTRDETGESEVPTHWMPLPEPPKFAALLPDTAGTIRTKEDDALTRVDKGTLRGGLDLPRRTTE